MAPPASTTDGQTIESILNLNAKKLAALSQSLEDMQKDWPPQTSQDLSVSQTLLNTLSQGAIGVKDSFENVSTQFLAMAASAQEVQRLNAALEECKKQHQGDMQKAAEAHKGLLEAEKQQQEATKEDLQKEQKANVEHSLQLEAKGRSLALVEAELEEAKTKLAGAADFMSEDDEGTIPASDSRPKRARPQSSSSDGDNGQKRHRSGLVRRVNRPAQAPRGDDDKAARAEAAQTNAATLRSMFLIAWDATPEETTAFEDALRPLFRLRKPIDDVIKAMDDYCMGPTKSRPPYPPPCLFAKLASRTAGEGGSRMTQSSCKTCKTKNRVCLWAKFAPGVATGYGLRNVQGEIDEANNGRDYNPALQPRTITLGDQEVRWIVKRRKVSLDDPDEEDWNVDAVTV